MERRVCVCRIAGHFGCCVVLCVVNIESGSDGALVLAGDLFLSQSQRFYAPINGLLHDADNFISIINTHHTTKCSSSRAVSPICGLKRRLSSRTGLSPIPASSEAS